MPQRQLQRDRADKTMRLMPYPPRWKTVLAPAWPPVVTASASVVYAPSRRVTHVANWGAWALTRLGIGALAWRSGEAWDPPMGDETFSALMAEWSALTDGDVLGFVVYRRLQEARNDGAAVLLRTRRGGMFAKVTTNQTELDTDIAVASAANDEGRRFDIPEMLGTGTTNGWRWIASRPISLRPHAPVIEASVGTPDGLTGGITRLVESTIERPIGTPAHWTGSHGDLTPWNLRRASRSGKPCLIDWSDAGWRPPGADRLYYRAVVSAIDPSWSGPIPVAADEEEAAEHWATVQAGRTAAPGEERLHERLTATFAQVR